MKAISADKLKILKSRKWVRTEDGDYQHVDYQHVDYQHVKEEE